MERIGRIVEGALPFEVARFGVPLALGMALQTTFNLVDAYLIAQLPASEVGAALGALGICDQIAAVGTILSYGVTTGAAALLSMRAGAGDEAGVRRVAWQSTLLITLLGAAFAVAGLFFAGPLVRDVIGAKGDVAAFATRYLRVSVGGSFTIFFLLHLTGIQRALGSAKTPVALLVFGNVLNVLFAIVLIFGPGPAPWGLGWAADLARALHVPRMGMLGAAWATILARALVLVPNVFVVAKRFGLFVPPRGARGPDAPELGRIVAIAWPSSAQFVLRIAGMLLVNSLAARYFTTEDDQTASTAMGLVFRLDTLALFVAMGWGSAAQTFVGQNVGAGSIGRARRSGWITAGYDAVTNVGIALLAVEWGRPILRLFDADPAPLAIAMQYLHVVAPAYLGLGLGIVLGNAMAGAGATATTFRIDLAVIVGVEAPLAIVVCERGGTLRDLFVCVAATYFIGAIAYAVVYARGRWSRSARA
jgi:putative MATE family efflux protein